MKIISKIIMIWFKVKNKLYPTKINNRSKIIFFKKYYI